MRVHLQRVREFHCDDGESRAGVAIEHALRDAPGERRDPGTCRGLAEILCVMIDLCVGTVRQRDQSITGLPGERCRIDGGSADAETVDDNAAGVQATCAASRGLYRSACGELAVERPR